MSSIILGGCILFVLFSMVTAMLSMHADENDDNRDLYVIMGTNLVMFWILCAELGRSLSVQNYQISGWSLLVLFLASAASIVFSALRINDLPAAVKLARGKLPGRLIDFPHQTNGVLNYCILGASSAVCLVAVLMASSFLVEMYQQSRSRDGNGGMKTNRNPFLTATQVAEQIQIPSQIL
jgi:hypothetical protein